eukprot:PhM_4_TR3064/c4_g1_i2/m.90966
MNKNPAEETTLFAYLLNGDSFAPSRLDDGNIKYAWYNNTNGEVLSAAKGFRTEGHGWSGSELTIKPHTLAPGSATDIRVNVTMPDGSSARASYKVQMATVLSGGQCFVSAKASTTADMVALNTTLRLKTYGWSATRLSYSYAMSAASDSEDNAEYLTSAGQSLNYVDFTAPYITSSVSETMKFYVRAYDMDTGVSALATCTGTIKANAALQNNAKKVSVDIVKAITAAAAKSDTDGVLRAAITFASNALLSPTSAEYRQVGSVVVDRVLSVLSAPTLTEAHRTSGVKVLAAFDDVIRTKSKLRARANAFLKNVVNGTMTRGGEELMNAV